MKMKKLAVSGLVLASLVAGATHVFAEEHNPQNPDDIRIAVLKEDGGYIDTHSDRSREIILQILYAHAEKAHKIHEYEDALKRVVKDDTVRAYSNAIVSEVSTCPVETRRKLGITDDAIVAVLPEVAFQNEANISFGFNITPYLNCTSDQGLCNWTSGVQVTDGQSDQQKRDSYVGILKPVYDHIHNECVAGDEARHMIKNSAKVEIPALNQTSPADTAL